MSRSSKDLLAILREASDGATDLFSVSGRLRKLLASEEDPLFPLVWALEYDYVDPDEAERREQWGPWAPMFEGDGTAYPPPLEGVSEDVLRTWATLAEGLNDIPIVAARLHDLLWERRWGDKEVLHAWAAVDAYMASLESLPDDLTRAVDLLRALELARFVHDKERLETIVPKVVEAAGLSLQAADAQPGVALPLIEAILGLPNDERPAEADGLLATAREKYRSDPFLSQTVLDLMAASVGDPEVRRGLHEEQVSAWLEKAAIATGVTRLAFLRRAQETALAHGLTDRADEAALLIQELQLTDDDFATFSSPISISEEAAEAQVNRFLGEDWQESLARIGRFGPPSGQLEENLKLVDESMKQSPLLYIFPKSILGPFDMPLREIVGEEAQRDQALIDQEQLRIEIDARFRAEALARMRDRYGVPSSMELAAFFETPLISQEIARRIARSLEFYWDGQYDEATHVLLPRLEAIIRRIAHDLGIVLVRPPRGSKPGGVRLLGELLRALAGHYDESWRRYLWNALVEITGLNLRNTFLHGLAPLADREQAAILIQIACHLRLVRVGDAHG